MTNNTTKPDSSPATETAADLSTTGSIRLKLACAIGFDEPSTMFEGELDMALSRPRYLAVRAAIELRWSGRGWRYRSSPRLSVAVIAGKLRPSGVAVPRARLNTPDGKTTEWKSQALRAYQRRTLTADALIASSYLAGTNTRRVRRALGALFGGAVGKDTVSRVWRKVKSDWDAVERPLACR